MKKSVLLGMTLAVMAIPSLSMAHCGVQKKGAFNVSCETGVQVYRNAPLQAPRIDPNVQARLESDAKNREVQRDAIASRERIAGQSAAIANRRAATDEFFSRSLVERPSNLSRLGFGNRFNNFGNRGFSNGFAATGPGSNARIIKNRFTPRAGSGRVGFGSSGRGSSSAK